MTNEEEQITLNIDLYDNIMTEKEGDYTGRPRITGTLYNKQIAARIVKAGTEYKQESIEYILDRADKAKVEAIAEGKSVIDGVGQYLVTARGSFIGENAQFDPVKHSLGVSYTPGQLLRSQLKKTQSRLQWHSPNRSGHQFHHRQHDRQRQRDHHLGRPRRDQLQQCQSDRRRPVCRRLPDQGRRGCSSDEMPGHHPQRPIRTHRHAPRHRNKGSVHAERDNTIQQQQQDAEKPRAPTASPSS